MSDETELRGPWWHLEGDIVIGGRRVHRYRAWHPCDPVHASYAWRRPDRSIGAGAAICLRGFLNGDPRYPVATLTTIEKLDEAGFFHNPRLHGVPGLVRMEYRFERVAGVRHNVEEVGLFEHIMPPLYRQETGRDG